MAFEGDSPCVDFYEVLTIAPDATTAVIQQALDSYRETKEKEANNPRTMKSALYALNEIIPNIQQHLLSSTETRAAYDQYLTECKKRQAEHTEPADNEGLGDLLEHPFFFDPLDGYDTEAPAYSLREVAMRLDEEWPLTLSWIKGSFDKTHTLVGYLTFGAGRQRLATHIEEIIHAVSRSDNSRMNVNEGIERCINILNPEIERPRVYIDARHFDGQILDGGSFIPDLPAWTEFTLKHDGFRGCAFGVIESHTDWLTFQGGLPSTRFALMPKGANPELGVAAIKLSLIFRVSNLARNAEHCAELVIRMENQDPVAEIPLQVLIHVQPLPPRVIFESAATQVAPVWAGTTRRGIPTSVVVIPRNAGDEKLLPLVARIYTYEDGASARPERFHANEPITLAINTSKRPYGNTYNVVFKVDYSLTSGARGPDTVQVQGEILPTPWQSMLREKNFSERFFSACGIGILGLLLLGGIGAGLASTGLRNGWWLLLLIPILLILPIRPTLVNIVKHIQRSGNNNARIEYISPWILWGIPIGVGAITGLICGLIPDTATSFFISGSIGALAGIGFGFFLGVRQPPS